jgi:hypothetical protein
MFCQKLTVLALTLAGVLETGIPPTKGVPTPEKKLL